MNIINHPFSSFLHTVQNEHNLRIDELENRTQYEEMLFWDPPLFAKGFWGISSFPQQFHLICELADKPDFLDYWEEIQKVYPLSNLEVELEKLEQDDSGTFDSRPYMLTLEALDVKATQEVAQMLGLLSNIWENSEAKENLSYERLFGNVTSDESFHPRHLLTSKALVENTLAKCEVVKDLAISEMAMKEEIASLPEKSIFKQYLINAGALGKQGQLPNENGFSESRRNIRYALQVLARVLKTDLVYDLKTWNEKTPNLLYTRFANVLETGNYDATIIKAFRGINKLKNDEKKIEEALKLLNEQLTGKPGIQKLKDALSIKIKEEDLGDFPGIQLPWDPSKSLLEQRDEGFKFLCLEALFEVSQKRNIEIGFSAHYLAAARGDFSGLSDVLSQMPKLGDRIRAKVIDLCKGVNLSIPLDVSTYDLYCLFKQDCKNHNESLKEGTSQNVEKTESEPPLVVIKPPVIEAKISLSPTTTNEESSSVGNDIPSPEKPDPCFIKDIKTFRDWINENNTSVLSHFLFQKRVLACQGEEPQLLEVAHLAIETYTDALKLEAKMLKDPCPDVFGSLEELDGVSMELAYKKFLKGLGFAKKKYPENAVLSELHEISNRDIPTKEKRALSIQTLDGVPSEPHLAKLEQCLTSLFNAVPAQSFEEINVEEAFSSSKAKRAAFKWLSESSFLKSLEVEIGTKNHPQIERALLVFREKMINEMERLDMPFIYLDVLDHAMKKGNIEGLKYLLAEVAHKRYINAVKGEEYEGKQKLLSLDEQNTHVSILERVKQCKEHVRANVEDSLLANYFLFRLEQLPYNSRGLSEEDTDVICAYLSGKNTSRPFDLYLQANNFSWVGYDEEPCDWFAYLYEEFTEQITKEARTSRFSTIQSLTLELEKLDPFDLPKIDQLAACIRLPNGITVQELYNLGFVWSVREALNSRKCEEKHLRHFEAVTDMSVQIAILDNLARSMDFAYLVHATIRDGSPRSFNVGYEFLKELMIKENKETLSSFFYVHFMGYSDNLVQFISKESEEEAEKVQQLEIRLQGEWSDSPLRKLLRSDGVINDEGRLIGLFSLMPLHSLEPYIRTIKVFAEINLEEPTPNPYQGSSWLDLLEEVNGMLKDEKEPESFIFCWSEDVDGLIEGVLDKTLGSFSSSLYEIAINQMPCMQSDIYYEEYLRWEREAFLYFKEKLTKLENQKEFLINGFKDKNDRRIPAFQKAVDTVVNADISKNLRESLKEGIEERDWEAVNETADQIIYMEYQIALIDSIGSRYKGKVTEALRKVLPQLQNKLDGSPKDKIQAALSNLPKFLPDEDLHKLRSILRNEEWMGKQEACIRSNWNWAQKKSYLRSFHDINSDPYKLTLFEKQAILGSTFCSLATSLLAEVRDLGMNEGFEEMIKRAHYENSLFLWDWIVEEVSYQKCLSMIQDAKDDEKDMSIFDDLEEVTRNCTIYEKLSLVLQRLQENQDSPDCKMILDRINQSGFFELEVSSLLVEEESVEGGVIEE